MSAGHEGEELADVLIVTAVKDEWDAVLAVNTGAKLGSSWEKRTEQTGPDIALRKFTTAGGELRVAVVQAFGMGREQAVIAAAPLLARHPEIRCLAMCGVCAGRRDDVALGDVIIADRTWPYDAGKLKASVNEQGERTERFEGDIDLYRIHPPEWKQRAERFQPDPTARWIKSRPRSYQEQGDWLLERLDRNEDPATDADRPTKCADWEAVLKQLWKLKWLRGGEVELTQAGRKHIRRRMVLDPGGVREAGSFKVVVGSIASGAPVVQDPTIFDRLAETAGMRKVVGLEMETSAILALAYLQKVPHAVVMKGVMDHADAFKSDNMKSFAALASAECLIAFLRENLTPVSASNGGRAMSSGLASSDLSAAVLSAESVFERVQLDRFVGREWLEMKIDDFLRAHDRGYVVIESRAGLGKTSFCAHLVATRGYPHHFVELAPGEEGVGAGLRSLAAQLILSLDRSSGHVEQRLTHAAMARTERFAPEQFSALLNEIAVASAGAPIVLIVDGLDEAGDAGQANRMGLPVSLPKGVFFIVSHRPGPALTTRSPKGVFQITADSADNLCDIRAYAKASSQRPLICRALSGGIEGGKQRPYDTGEFVEALVNKSGGVWMYLYLLIAEIESGNRTPLDLSGLPDGLWNYYASFWDGFRARDTSAWYDCYLPLLAMVMATAEPVSFELLCTFTSIDSNPQLKRLMDVEWGAFLLRTRVGGSDLYRAYHISVSEFFHGILTERLEARWEQLSDELSEATTRAHGAVADRYLRAWGGLGNILRGLSNAALRDMDGGYGLRHLCTHLLLARRRQEVHELLALTWPGGEAASAVNVWFAAHDGASSVDRFVADQRRALGSMRMFATREDAFLALIFGVSASQIHIAFRYELAIASIADRASLVPAPLIGLLLATGQWTFSKALTYIRQIGDVAEQAKALARIARAAPPRQADDIMREALDRLDDAEAFPSLMALGWIIRTVGPEFHPDLSRRLRAATRQVQWFKAWGTFRLLAAFGPHLPARTRRKVGLAATNAWLQEEYQSGALYHSMYPAMPWLPAVARRKLLDRTIALQLPTQVLYVADLMPFLTSEEQAYFLREVPEAAHGIGDGAFWLADGPVRQAWEILANDPETPPPTLSALLSRMPKAEAIERAAALPEETRKVVLAEQSLRAGSGAVPRHDVERFELAAAIDKLGMARELVVGRRVVDQKSLREAFARSINDDRNGDAKPWDSKAAGVLIDNLEAPGVDLAMALEARCCSLGDDTARARTRMYYASGNNSAKDRSNGIRRAMARNDAEIDGVPIEEVFLGWCFTRSPSPLPKNMLEQVLSVAENSVNAEMRHGLAVLASTSEPPVRDRLWNAILSWMESHLEFTELVIDSVNCTAWALPATHMERFCAAIEQLPPEYFGDALWTAAPLLSGQVANRAFRAAFKVRRVPTAMAACGALLGSVSESYLKVAVQKLLSAVDADSGQWQHTTAIVGLYPHLEGGTADELWQRAASFGGTHHRHEARLHALCARCGSGGSRLMHWRNALHVALDDHSARLALLPELIDQGSTETCVMKAMLFELGRLGRRNALDALCDWRPFLGSKLTPDSLAAVALAIEDVGRWWP